MTTTVLPLSEVFGPTFQGEGPHTGRRTGFVRLGLCNLSCEWCDTPYTWDDTRYDVKAECPDTPVAVIHDALRGMDVDTVTLSGGEPLMHRAKLPHLLTPEWTWHAETNGTIAPPPYWAELVEHTTVSPKINTRDPHKKRIKPKALAGWRELTEAGSACFKFVVSTERDLDRVDEVVHANGLAAEHIWIMPEGVTAGELITRHQLLAGPIEDRGWNTTTRLHVLLYGQERGK